MIDKTKRHIWPVAHWSRPLAAGRVDGIVNCAVLTRRARRRPRASVMTASGRHARDALIEAGVCKTDDGTDPGTDPGSGDGTNPGNGNGTDTAGATASNPAATPPAPVSSSFSP